jgi:hypothetical protein
VSQCNSLGGISANLTCNSRENIDCFSGSCCLDSLLDCIDGYTQSSCISDGGSFSLLHCVNRTGITCPYAVNNDGNGKKSTSTSSSKTNNTVIIASVLIGACAGIVLLTFAICGIYRYYRKNKHMKNKKQQE